MKLNIAKESNTALLNDLKRLNPATNVAGTNAMDAVVQEISRRNAQRDKIVERLKALRALYSAKESYDLLKEYWKLIEELKTLDPGNPEGNKGIHGGEMFGWSGD